VKADAYGHGAVPVARALATAGADGFCVATFDEALELRQGGIRLPILVLYPVPPDLVLEAARRSFAVAASDAELLRRTLEALVRAADADAAGAGLERPGRAPTREGRTGRRRPLRLHLEIETGLGRGGLPAEAAPAAAAAIAETPGAVLAGVWSHLAIPEDAATAARQEVRFREASAILHDAQVRLPARHLASSGGILAATVPPYDAVRLGLAVYGLIPEAFPVSDLRAGAAAALRPVLSLRARPVRVIDLPPGTGIGYDATFVTARPSRIATLPIGYGDGWSRAYSNRADALVRGGRVPLVGNVAMDAVMADVTDVPGPPVTVDDEFVLLGEQGGAEIAVAELARARATNSWEVVTAMARRLPRVYDSAAGTRGIRTLSDGKVEWRASSSGTATSATSRSTRSSTPRT
jgi:alanine racemase